MQRLFMGLFFVAMPLFAQTQHALLWKISGNGLEKPSFIYGTFHQVCPQDFTPSKATKAALKFVDEIHFEIHMDSLFTDAFDEESFAKFSEVPLNPSDSLLDVFGKKATYNQLAFQKNRTKQIDSLISPIDKVLIMDYMNKNKNIYYEKTVTIYTLNQIIRNASFSRPNCNAIEMISYERSLYELPESTKKPQFGLASKKEHFSYFRYLEQNLAQTIYSALQTVKFEKELFKAFKTDEKNFFSGNVHQLRKDYFGQLLNEPAAEAITNKALLDERNLLWIPRIINRIHRKSVFYGVGASHLGGQMGLINLLQKRGYTVTACLNFG